MRGLLLALSAALLVLTPVAFARRSFTDTEPLAAKEWYLEADNAWSFWPTAPTLAPVRVAVIDSGIDGSHPEFAGRIRGWSGRVPGGDGDRVGDLGAWATGTWSRPKSFSGPSRVPPRRSGPEPDRTRAACGVTG